MAKANIFSKDTIDVKKKIWRFMDFTKFLSLLDKKSLYFTRLDKLGDPYEGATSKKNIELRPRVYKEIIKKFKGFPEMLSERNQEIRKYYLVNCWYMNEFESAAMWKLYLKSDEGIAIQSTVRKLASSFRINESKAIEIGKVNYIDYANEYLPEGNIFYPILHKRKSFEYENEVRAIYLEFAAKPKKDDEEAYEIDIRKEVYTHGKYIVVDLNTLIETIYVSPTASNWFTELVISVIKKYNIPKEVKQSSLRDDPVF